MLATILNNLVYVFLIIFIGFIMALAAGLMDYYMVIYISDERKAEQDANTWPSVTGTVLSARAVTHGLQGIHNTRADFPEVAYSFEVDGKTYKSKHIAAGGQIGGAGVGGVLARYPVGSQVTVYYDPKNPKNAVLEKKSVVQSWLWVILIFMNILLCIVVPVWITISLFK